MLKRIVLLICGLVLCVSSGATADTAPSSDACSGSDPASLAASLPQHFSTRSLLPVENAIPAGEEGAVTIAGLAALPTQKDWQFRVLVSSREVGIHALGSADLVEVHPTAVEHGASGEPKESYTLHFVAPADGDGKLLHLRRKHSVIVIACDGDAVGAWAVRPVAFAPPAPAQFWAALFVLAIYVCAGVVVYTKRRTGTDADDQPDKIYRIERVNKWSLLRCLNPVAMTADIFDRGSLPKFQILFFVLLVAWGVAYLAIWTGELSDLSVSLIYLLGLPALGSLGSQLTSTNRDRLSADNWAWLVSRKVLPLNDPGAQGGPRWSDLVMTDTELDMSKLQALTFSFIIGFSMIAAGPQAFGKFHVPDTWLQILGLSQLVLVGGRLVKPATVADVDAQITELRVRESALRKAAITGVDVDDSGKPLGPTPTTLPKSPAVVDEAAKTIPNAVTRYRETAAKVQILLEAMANRTVDGAPLMNFKLP